MPNLGELLAGNIQREKTAERDAVAAIAEARTEEARRELAIAKKFFDDARVFFTDGITEGKKVSTLFLQVGGYQYSGFKGEKHQEFDSVLEGYRFNDEKKGPLTLENPKKLAPMWHEFQSWARENGLVAKWQYCWDGGGMESWWLLQVEPALTN